MKDDKIGSNAIFLKNEDIKAIIAEKYGVEEESIIKTQYSYIVLIGEEEQEPIEK